MSVRNKLQKILKNQEELKNQLEMHTATVNSLYAQLTERQKSFDFLKSKTSKTAKVVLATITEELNSLTKQKEIEEQTVKEIMMKLNQLAEEYTHLKENEEGLYIQEQCSEMVQRFLEELKKHLIDWTKLYVEDEKNRVDGLTFNLSEFWKERTFPLYWASGRTTWYSKKYPSGCFSVSNSRTKISIYSKDFYFDEKLQVTWHHYDDNGWNENLAYTWYCKYCKEWYEEFKKKFYKCFLDTLTDKYNCNEYFILKVTSSSSFTLELV